VARPPSDLVVDFDGAIVRPDTIRLLADLGMGPLRSRQLAREVDRGRVPVRDAVDRTVASVATTPEIAFGFLEARARLDPGFPRLVDWAVEARVGRGRPVAYVGGGRGDLQAAALAVHALRLARRRAARAGGRAGPRAAGVLLTASVGSV
jgi:hypothetical protein